MLSATSEIGAYRVGWLAGVDDDEWDRGAKKRVGSSGVAEGVDVGNDAVGRMGSDGVGNLANLYDSR